MNATMVGDCAIRFLQLRRGFEPRQSYTIRLRPMVYIGRSIETIDISTPSVKLSKRTF